jgi:hypothetical protein
MSKAEAKTMPTNLGDVFDEAWPDWAKALYYEREALRALGMYPKLVTDSICYHQYQKERKEQTGQPLSEDDDDNGDGSI